MSTEIKIECSPSPSRHSQYFLFILKSACTKRLASADQTHLTSTKLSQIESYHAPMNHTRALELMKHPLVNSSFFSACLSRYCNDRVIVEGSVCARSEGLFKCKKKYETKPEHDYSSSKVVGLLCKHAPSLCFIRMKNVTGNLVSFKRTSPVVSSTCTKMEITCCIMKLSDE